MKIVGVTTRLVRLDMKSWYGRTPIPAGVPLEWQIPLVTVTTDTGLQGHATGYDTYGGGPSVATLIRDQYRPAILGEDPLHTEKLWHKYKWLNRHLRNARDAASGLIDVCCWDIRGQAAGLPIAALLGIYRTKVPCYATAAPLTITTVEATIEQVKRAREAGYHGCKLQLWDGPARDIPRLRAAREAAGSDFLLMVDSSGVYNYTEAIEVGHVLDELNYHWFEEPVHDAQTDILKRLADQLRTPILAAETTTAHEVPDYIRNGSVDIVRGDAYIKGGITGLRKALATCELFGYDVEIHTAATPLLDVANLQIACSVKNCGMVEHHHPVFRFGLRNGPLEIDRDGYQHLPAGPGLGVEIDWDWIEHHTIAVVQ